MLVSLATEQSSAAAFGDGPSGVAFAPGLMKGASAWAASIGF